jgi:hypothetical protein
MRTAAAAVALCLAISLEAVAGQSAAAPQPPVEVRHKDGEQGPEKWAWQGQAVVPDPVNQETLYLGGRVGGAEFGSIGSWALAEDGKTWRELRFSSAALDPLRAKAMAARRPAKDAEAAARNVFYAGMDPAREAEEVRNEPARLVGEAVRLTEELNGALGAAVAEGWEKDAVAHAQALAGKALAGLKAAQAGFAGGKVDAAILRNCFDVQWALDEAADCLAASPGPRENPAAAFDPESKCVVLFGGSHGDYMTNDTWVYDCARKTWRQVWPRTAPSARMGAAMTWVDAKKALRLSGGQTVLSKMVYQQGEMPAPDGEWLFDARAGEWTGQGGAAAGSRLYRTVVAGYDPCWYDAAPRGDSAATAQWIADLKPNVWTAVPIQPAPAPERDWGTAVLDPDRDQVYRWTGGHCADPSTIVSTYHPAVNRWSIPYVAEIMLPRKGMTFNGRPDCANHTYLHYAYDAVSKRLICVAMGGTGVYNPDRRDFDFTAAHPFNRSIYETCTAGTSRGVVVWVRGYLGLFDVKARAWKGLPVQGRLPAPCCDGSALAYDSKRDVLWMATFAGYQKASGNLWRYDMKTGAVGAVDPANAETVGKAKGFNSEIRESVYLPTADLVLYSNFVNTRQVAYDPGGNRWVVLNIERRLERQGTVSDTLVWDPKRGLVWNLNAYKLMYVLKIAPKALVLSDDPAR